MQKQLIQNFIINEVYKPENGPITELEEEQYCSNQRQYNKDSIIESYQSENGISLKDEANNYTEDDTNKGLIQKNKLFNKKLNGQQKRRNSDVIDKTQISQKKMNLKNQNTDSKKLKTAPSPVANIENRSVSYSKLKKTLKKRSFLANQVMFSSFKQASKSLNKNNYYHELLNEDQESKKLSDKKKSHKDNEQKKLTIDNKKVEKHQKKPWQSDGFRNIQSLKDDALMYPQYNYDLLFEKKGLERGKKDQKEQKKKNKKSHL